MAYLVREYNQAVALRKKGYSYRDILKEVKVAKSTLSSWLKDMPLTSEEKQALKKRKDSNISRGRIKAAAALRRRRLEREDVIFREAVDEFKQNMSDAFFQVGVSLYWAEGAKRSSGFSFTNSDPEMMKLMIRWIEIYFGIHRNQLYTQLYIHKAYQHENCEAYWVKEAEISRKTFRKTIVKPNKALVKRRPNYKGCLRIATPKGLKHLRKMKVWQKLLVEYYNDK